jgi:hypothetical protein
MREHAMKCDTTIARDERSTMQEHVMRRSAAHDEPSIVRRSQR